MKILIISNHAYPVQGPRAFRTTELSEQLVKMGHEVVLYTVHGKYDYTQYEKEVGVKMRDINPKFATSANDGTHRYNIFDKFMYHFFHRLLMWPQCEFHFAVEKIIKNNPNMDMLITIAYPHSIHSGAARAKKKHPAIFPKTWICDCGDPFMLNPFIRAPKFMKHFEDMWCSMCDYITVPTKESYKGYYEQYWGKIRVIPQGFDFSKTPIEEYKKTARPKVVMTWAPHPRPLPQAVPNSFAEWMNATDYDFVITHPEGYELDPQFVGHARVEYDQMKAFEGADFIYAKNWAAYAGDNYGQILSKDREWTVSDRQMAVTNNAYFMHCLPVRRNMIVTDDVIESPQSIVIPEAANREISATVVLKRLLESL